MNEFVETLAISAITSAASAILAAFVAVKVLEERVRHIQTDVSEVKEDMKDVRRKVDSHNNFDARLARTEESLASAHHRIDRMEKAK